MFKVFYFKNRDNNKGVNISSSRMEGYDCFHKESEIDKKEELGLPEDTVFISDSVYTDLKSNPSKYVLKNKKIEEIPEKELLKEREKEEDQIEILRIKGELINIDKESARPVRQMLNAILYAKDQAKGDPSLLLQVIDSVEELYPDDTKKIKELENKANNLRQAYSELLAKKYN